jgi:hypothetical protein
MNLIENKRNLWKNVYYNVYQVRQFILFYHNIIEFYNLNNNIFNHVFNRNMLQCLPG